MKHLFKTLIVLGVLSLPLMAAAMEIENPLKAETFEEVIDAVINFIVIIAIAIAPIMLIVAGFLFVTAAGDPKAVDKAKKIILWTCVGLVIVLLGKGLIKVLEQVLGG